MTKPRSAFTSGAISQTSQPISEAGKFSLKPTLESLDELVAQITPKNRHALLLDDAAQGREAW